jgi:hypothetical protein
MKEVIYYGMMEHFAKQARKKLKIICKNLKIMTAIDTNVKNIIQSNKIWLDSSNCCVKSYRLRSNKRQKISQITHLKKINQILLATFYHQLQNIHKCKMQYCQIFYKLNPLLYHCNHLSLHLQWITVILQCLSLLLQLLLSLNN